MPTIELPENMPGITAGFDNGRAAKPHEGFPAAVVIARRQFSRVRQALAPPRAGLIPDGIAGSLVVAAYRRRIQVNTAGGGQGHFATACGGAFEGFGCLRLVAPAVVGTSRSGIAKCPTGHLSVASAHVVLGWLIGAIILIKRTIREEGGSSFVHSLATVNGWLRSVGYTPKIGAEKYCEGD